LGLPAPGTANETLGYLGSGVGMARILNLSRVPFAEELAQPQDRSLVAYTGFHLGDDGSSPVALAASAHATLAYLASEQFRPQLPDPLLHAPLLRDQTRLNTELTNLLGSRTGTGPSSAAGLLELLTPYAPLMALYRFGTAAHPNSHLTTLHDADEPSAADDDGALVAPLPRPADAVLVLRVHNPRAAAAAAVLRARPAPLPVYTAGGGRLAPVAAHRTALAQVPVLAHAHQAVVRDTEERHRNPAAHVEEPFAFQPGVSANSMVAAAAAADADTSGDPQEAGADSLGASSAHNTRLRTGTRTRTRTARYLPGGRPSQADSDSSDSDDDPRPAKRRQVATQRQRQAQAQMGRRAPATPVQQQQQHQYQQPADRDATTFPFTGNATAPASTIGMGMGMGMGGAGAAGDRAERIDAATLSALGPLAQQQQQQHAGPPTHAHGHYSLSYPSTHYPGPHAHAHSHGHPAPASAAATPSLLASPAPYSLLGASQSHLLRSRIASPARPHAAPHAHAAPPSLLSRGPAPASSIDLWSRISSLRHLPDAGAHPAPAPALPAAGLSGSLGGRSLLQLPLRDDGHRSLRDALQSLFSPGTLTHAGNAQTQGNPAPGPGPAAAAAAASPTSAAAPAASPPTGSPLRSGLVSLLSPPLSNNPTGASAASSAPGVSRFFSDQSFPCSAATSASVPGIPASASAVSVPMSPAATPAMARAAESRFLSALLRGEPAAATQVFMPTEVAEEEEEEEEAEDEDDGIPTVEEEREREEEAHARQALVEQRRLEEARAQAQAQAQAYMVPVTRTRTRKRASSPDATDAPAPPVPVPAAVPVPVPVPGSGSPLLGAQSAQAEQDALDELYDFGELDGGGDGDDDEEEEEEVEVAHAVKRRRDGAGPALGAVTVTLRGPPVIKDKRKNSGRRFWAAERQGSNY
jgi:hypothetical protein